MQVGVGTIPSRTCKSGIQLKQYRRRDKIEYLSSPVYLQKWQWTVIGKEKDLEDEAKCVLKPQTTQREFSPIIGEGRDFCPGTMERCKQHPQDLLRRV